MSGLRVQNLSHSYGAKQALKDVGFEIERGRFCALLGPNGAGKSTLYAILTGLLVPNGGTIEIADTPLRETPLRALAKMGIVFQQTTLDLDLSVRQNLRYFAALHGFAGKAADIKIDAALDRLGMLERAGEKVRALNGGHKRRTEIARALLHAPEVLLLDEPTVGLDSQTRIAITEHVHRLCTEDGLTVLWATHLTDEVRPTDDLILLHKGEVLERGTAAQICGGLPLSEVFMRKVGEPL
ncbi:ABC transporter ATP-binding protein [Marivivens sp. LCG002]|uniref:ABC transporter ATP-binding protein n=1 Tax=Marivivens sp. LCG002 TaxID=3051171 RepID=UPI0025558FAA|nr:ABC transporter ATP-binding protein [Marivivens sp. LCG002]WIV51762.1 ABC transporter ATP-binding protein [Marivivens sp. LCG002]